MRTTILCFLTIAALLPGCSPTKAGISDQPIPDNQIYITAGAQVNSPSNTGKALYTAYCVLQYADTGHSNAVFNSAKVTVNGVALESVYGDGAFQSVGSAMMFEEGDTLRFVIKHEKIGTIKGVVYVPPSVPSVSVSPGLSMADLPNYQTTFNLNWNPVAATYYIVEATGYNSRQSLVVYDSSFGTQADSAIVLVHDSSGSACPWVYFRVQSVNFVPIAGFAPGSGFNVTGAYYKGNTNIPNVSSNKRVMRYSGK